jgi:hypothetical protein
VHHYQCLCLLSLSITQSLEQGLPQGADLVLAGGEQVEQGDEGALELGAAAGVDGGRGEALPDDRLADCLNEEVDAGALLEQLVLEEDDEAGHEQLDDGHELDLMSLGSPYMPVITYSVCAPLIKALCLGMSPTSIRPVFGREGLIEIILFLKGRMNGQNKVPFFR